MDLKVSIHKILKSVSEETLDNIVVAIKEAGLESPLDVQFVKEDDLILVLKPIPRRKLVKMWSEQTVSENNSNSLQQHKFRWKKRRGLKLLQVYAKHKIGFSYPGVEENHVWRKIAEELKKKYSFNCNEFQCCSKIKELKSYYATIKNNPVITAYVADFLDLAKTAFENPVPIKSLDELLKPNICSILNSASEETVCSIIGALMYAGVESLSDLQFVQEEDLLFILKPIQRRKLVKAWSEPDISYPVAAESPGRETKPKCKWLWKKRLALLRLYTVHKAEFSSSNVWEKVANELKKVSLGFKNCDALQCENQIHYMKCAYEKKKGLLNAASQKEALFLDEAKRAFDTLENPVSVSDHARPENRDKQSTENLQKWTWVGGDRSKLLQIYTNYKTELVIPDSYKNQKVWKKIAKEAAQQCSLYCGVWRCRYEIKCLRKRYESYKIKDPKGSKIPHYFKEMQKAFGTTKCLEAEAESELKGEGKPAEEKIKQENGNKKKHGTSQTIEKSTKKGAETGIKRKNKESKKYDAGISPKKIKEEKDEEVVVKKEIEESEELGVENSLHNVKRKIKEEII